MIHLNLIFVIRLLHDYITIAFLNYNLDSILGLILLYFTSMIHKHSWHFVLIINNI